MLSVLCTDDGLREEDYEHNEETRMKKTEVKGKKNDK